MPEAKVVRLVIHLSEIIEALSNAKICLFRVSENNLHCALRLVPKFPKNSQNSHFANKAMCTVTLDF